MAPTRQRTERLRSASPCAGIQPSRSCPHRELGKPASLCPDYRRCLHLDAPPEASLTTRSPRRDHPIRSQPSDAPSGSNSLASTRRIVSSRIKIAIFYRELRRGRKQRLAGRETARVVCSTARVATTFGSRGPPTVVRKKVSGRR